VPAPDSGHDPRVLELSPEAGSLLSWEPASPSPRPPMLSNALSLLSQISKISKYNLKENMTNKD